MQRFLFSFHLVKEKMVLVVVESLRNLHFLRLHQCFPLHSEIHDYQVPEADKRSPIHENESHFLSLQFLA